MAIISDDMAKSVPAWLRWLAAGLIAGAVIAWTAKGILDRFEFLENQSKEYKEKADQDRRDIREERVSEIKEIRDDVSNEFEKVYKELEEAEERREYIDGRINKKFDQAKEYTDLKTKK